VLNTSPPIHYILQISRKKDSVCIPEGHTIRRIDPRAIWQLLETLLRELDRIVRNQFSARKIIIILVLKDLRCIDGHFKKILCTL